MRGKHAVWGMLLVFGSAGLLGCGDKGSASDKTMGGKVSVPTKVSPQPTVTKKKPPPSGRQN
jgi:hypothetical protein